MPYFIYKTTNLINSKYYIGVSNGNNSSYKGSGTALLKAMKIYGGKNFVKEILETFETEKEAFAREAEIVNEEFVNDKNTYNIKVGGKGGTGQLKTPEHKRKIANSIKEKHQKGEVLNNGKNAGRKPAVSFELTVEIYNKFGFVDGAKYFGISYEAFRSRYYLAKSKLTNSNLSV
jgi:hypothetical protein